MEQVPVIFVLISTLLNPSAVSPDPMVEVRRSAFEFPSQAACEAFAKNTPPRQYANGVTLTYTCQAIPKQ